MRERVCHMAVHSTKIQLRTVGHIISWEKAAQLHLLSWNTTHSPQLQIQLLCALLPSSGSCFFTAAWFSECCFLLWGLGKEQDMCSKSEPWMYLGR